MRFELPGAPADADAGPAVTLARDAQQLAVCNAGRLLLRLVEHHVLKALGAFQARYVYPAFAVKVLVNLLEMLVHLRKLHARICVQHEVDGHISLKHEQEHGRGILAS